MVTKALKLGEMMSNVKLKDIAAELGISIASVSKALNDKPDISEDVKRTVRRRAEEMGYQQNYFASNLALSRPNNLIGYIIPSAAELFTPQITMAVEDSAFAGDYNLLLGQSNNDFQRERLLIDSFVRKRVAGLILIAAPGKENIDYFRNLVKRMPVVFIDQHLGIPANYVLTNDREISFEAVRYLVELGHRRILVLGGLCGAGTTEDRLQGCRQAAGGSGTDSCTLVEAQVGFREEDAFNALIGMEKEGVEYSAVLCLSNRVAYGAIRFFRDRGVAIPEDVSLVGFANNSEEGGIRSLPGCTIVRQPTYEYGQKAVELLHGIIENKDGKGFNQVVLPSYLQIGSSTAAPRRGR